MKEKDKFLLTFSSFILFIVLLLAENFFYYTLSIDINNLGNLRKIVDGAYIFSSLCVAITFYLVNKKAKNVEKRLITFGKGMAALFTYFTLSELQTLPLVLSGVDYNVMPLALKVIYLLSFEILMVSAIGLILNKEIKKALTDIKKNHQKYFSKYLKFWLYSLIIMAGSNIIISFINGGGVAGNEETIRQIFTKAPIYMFISAVFIAPVLEELTFRQAFRNIFSNDKVFIIMSGLIFGGLHVVGNVNSPVDLLYLIPYCTPGFVFAYIMAKTDNVFVSMGLHFLHNGVMISLQILLMVLGQI